MKKLTKRLSEDDLYKLNTPARRMSGNSVISLYSKKDDVTLM